MFNGNEVVFFINVYNHCPDNENIGNEMQLGAIISSIYNSTKQKLKGNYKFISTIKYFFDHMTSHHRQYVLTFIKWAVISKLRWKWKVLGQLLRTSLNIYHLGQNGMLKQQRLLQQILAEQMGYCIDNRRKTLINIIRLVYSFLLYVK